MMSIGRSSRLSIFYLENLGDVQVILEKGIDAMQSSTGRRGYREKVI